MNIRFDGQVVLVTGAGRGLGAAYARFLAERGASVMIHDGGVSETGTGKDQAIAEIVAQDIVSAGGIALSATQVLGCRQSCRALIAQTLDQFGRLDALIHNAGLLLFNDIDAVSEAEFDRLQAVNGTAPFWLAQAALSPMRAQGYGRMVFTTSGRALSPASAAGGLTLYNMGKAAQLGLVQGLAFDLRQEDIKVNAIAPVAATRMLQREVAPDRFRPEQVAPAAVYLLSKVCQQSGLVLRCGDGKFSLAEFTNGPDLTLEDAYLTPENIANWIDPAD